MIQLSSPMLVSPRSWTVPRLKVQNSRIVLRWPMTNCVGSPAGFFFRRGAAEEEREGEDGVVCAQCGAPFDHAMRAYAAAGADHCLRADHGIWPDGDRRVQAGAIR